MYRMSLLSVFRPSMSCSIIFNFPNLYFWPYSPTWFLIACSTRLHLQMSLAFADTHGLCNVNEVTPSSAQSRSHAATYTWKTNRMPPAVTSIMNSTAVVYADSKTSRKKQALPALTASSSSRLLRHLDILPASQMACGGVVGTTNLNWKSTHARNTHSCSRDDGEQRLKSHAACLYHDVASAAMECKYETRISLCRLLFLKEMLSFFYNRHEKFGLELFLSFRACSMVVMVTDFPLCISLRSFGEHTVSSVETCVSLAKELLLERHKA